MREKKSTLYYIIEHLQYITLKLKLYNKQISGKYVMDYSLAIDLFFKELVKLNSYYTPKIKLITV